MGDSVFYRAILSKCFLIIISILLSFEVLAVGLKLKPEVVEKIENNTFMYVPINSYAPVISKERAREIYSTGCTEELRTPKDKLNCAVLESC